MSKDMILAVDDEPNNLRIIEMELDDYGYEVLTASDGLEAMEVLNQKSDEISAILLDRMMPNMDGMEVLRAVKADKNFSHIPVIMQTAAAEKSQITEGISAGAYYYLAKPYDEDVMVSIVKAALNDYSQIKNLKNKIELPQKIFPFMRVAEFEVNTLASCKNLAAFLATLFPDPERVLLGLTELILNGHEHGNLGITYDQKTQLMQQGKWLDEVMKRETSEENDNKKVTVSLSRDNDTMSVVISDEGRGFDWQNYLEISTERITHSHGRGVAMANLTSFDDMQYNEKGNQVTCIVHIEND